MAKDDKKVNPDETAEPSKPESLLGHVGKNIKDDLTGKQPEVDGVANSSNDNKSNETLENEKLSAELIGKHADLVTVKKSDEDKVFKDTIQYLKNNYDKLADNGLHIKNLVEEATKSKDLSTLKTRMTTLVNEFNKEIHGKDAPVVENGGKDDKGDKGVKPPPKKKKPRVARPPDGSKKQDKGKTAPSEVTEPLPPPRDAARSGEEEKIVYIDHAELHPFKNHPFQVRNDESMKNLVESVKERGVDQPALVRPREGGGFELVAGHRRQEASIQAGIKNLPCIVRNMSDEEAILAMTETNFNQRDNMLASERAAALKMQLDAIKRQGERFKGVASGDKGARSNAIVAERNNMSVKNVQRYIALNKLVPELMKYVDDGKVKFIPAVEMSYIKPEHQQYIAMTIESDGQAPSQAQAQRMRELDKDGKLNGDVIDGILFEDNKKEERKVIITGQELAKYFGDEKTPAEMKATILKAMDELKEKNPLEFGKTEKPPELEK